MSPQNREHINFSTLRLYGLAPTKEVFAENVKRIHYQAIRWHAQEARDPLELDP
jgi:hypothetical protein